MQNQNYIFEKATKTQCKLRMAIIGSSGCGKTYTSLLLASELGKKIALIDTERRSARKYSDIFDFNVLELDNFHPNHYIQAIDLAEKDGFKVLIIDSLSHAWNGTNGALNLVDQAASRMRTSNSFAAWRQVTPLHNKLIDTILKSNLHIIVTMRAKTEYSVEKDEKGKTVIRKIGLQPIQREGLEYEFDICGDMDITNNMVISKTRCSSLQQAVIPKPGKELALTLKEWLNSGEPIRKKPSTDKDEKLTASQKKILTILNDLSDKQILTDKKTTEFDKKIKDPKTNPGLMKFLERQLLLLKHLYYIRERLSAQEKNDYYHRIFASDNKGLSKIENQLKHLEEAA